MMHATALPQTHVDRAEARLEVARRAAALHEAWEAWRATHPDPAEIEQMRQEIGRMLSDRVEDAP